MWRKICGFLLRIQGWQGIGGPAPVDKCILVGAPHTCIWDFVIAYLFYTSVGGDALCLVKEDLCKIPVIGWLARKMGAIPVDRKNPAAITRTVIREMEKREKFHLAIAAEGTRKPVKRWKAGFHLIAREANVPVYLCIFTWKPKIIKVVCEFKLTDDANADMKRMQQMYEDMHLVGRHPERYITH